MYYIKIDEDKTNFYADIITLIYRTKEFLQKKKKKHFYVGLSEQTDHFCQ